MNKKRAGSQPKLFGPVMSVLFTVGVFFSSQLWAAILIGPLLQLVHKNGTNISDLLQSNAWISFTYVLLAEGAMLWTIHTLINVEFGSNFKILGLNKLRIKYFGYVLAGAAVYFILYIAILALASRLLPGLNVDQKQELGFDMAARGSALVPIFASLVIIAPITEELVVRGFLYNGLRTKLGFGVSAIIASALFGAAHLGEGGSGGLLWVGAIDTFILSMVLCYLRERTKSLWPSIGVHMIKNGLAFVLLFKIFN